jgi:hypothetical protein
MEIFNSDSKPTEPVSSSATDLYYSSYIGGNVNGISK